MQRFLQHFLSLRWGKLYRNLTRGRIASLCALPSGKEGFDLTAVEIQRGAGEDEVAGGRGGKDYGVLYIGRSDFSQKIGCPSRQM